MTDVATDNAQVTQTQPVQTQTKPARTGHKKLTLEQYLLVKALAAVRKALSPLNAQEKAIKERLAEIIGDKAGGTWDGATVVKIEDGSQSWTDRALLLDGWPEAYAATSRETKYVKVVPQ